MVNIPREGFVLLLKLGWAFLKSEDTTEVLVETTTELPATDKAESEPMKAYWETDKEYFGKRNQKFTDLFFNDAALDRIPDTTEEPVKESHYDFKKLALGYYSPDKSAYFDINGVPETPKVGTGISNSGRDAGVVAGIVVAVILGVIFIAGMIVAVMYRHYVHHNVTSMNFDNPVYRKTTEDQFALEKNGYAPGSKLYPSTVGEEAQEPLKPPGTNEFV